jgi:hypothetical protein
MKSKALTAFTVVALFATATNTKPFRIAALAFLLLTLIGCEGIAISRAHAQSSLVLSATYQFRSQGFVADGQPFFEAGFAHFFPDGTKCVNSTMHILNQPAKNIDTCQSGTMGTYSCLANVCNGVSGNGDSSVMYVSNDQSLIEIVGTNSDGTTWQAELHKQ